MAPEALKAIANAGFPADVWSVGAIGYWMVEGSPPFGSGVPAITRIIGDEALAKPSAFGRIGSVGPLEDGIWKILKKCLDRDIDKRPSADELVKMLSDFCYSTSARHEGKVEQIGTANSRNACFARTGAKRVFFHRRKFQGFGTQLEVGQRVSFSAYSGSPFDRSDLVLLLR